MIYVRLLFLVSILSSQLFALECEVRKIVNQALSTYTTTVDTQAQCDALNAQANSTTSTSSSSATDGIANTFISEAYTSTAEVKTTTVEGGCGFNNNYVIDPSLLSFEGGLLQRGINNLDETTVKNYVLENGSPKESFIQRYSGFKCKSPSEIQDASFPQGEDPEITLKEVDLSSGNYICSYSFLGKDTVYEIKYINKGCKSDPDYVNKTKNIFNSIPTNLAFQGGYGVYKLNTPWNVSEELSTLHENLLEGEKKLKQLQNDQPLTVDINGLDSHTNHQYTLPSIFVGILTGDTEFFNESTIIGSNGELNIRGFSAKNANNNGEQNVIENAADTIVDMLASLSGQFWGFYYYLMANINKAFSNIVTQLFGLGTIGVFSFAYIKKMSEDEKERNSMQFNFTHKFIGIFTAFAFFSAPIIPVNKGINEQYIYKSSSSKENRAATEEYIKNATAIQTMLRFSFQLGTYWTNVINDYAMFAYLKYVSSSYGQFEIKNLEEEYVKDIKNFLTMTALLKKNIDFFENTCAYNYFGELSGTKTLPKYISGESIQQEVFSKNNPLGFNKVDYRTCAFMYEGIQRASVNNRIEYQKLTKRYSNISEQLTSVHDTDVEELNNFLEQMVAVNNKLGWNSVIVIPLINHILDAKKIFKYMNDAESINEDIVSEIGSTKVSRRNLVKEAQKRELQENGSNTQTSTIEEESLWNKISGFFGEQISDNYELVDMFYTYVGKTGGMILGGIGGYTMYFIYPGFTELFTAILKAGLDNAILGLAESLYMLIPGASMLGKLADGIMGVGNIINGGVATFTGAEGTVQTMLRFIISYLISVGIYSFVIQSLMLTLIVALIIIKIIYYYIEIIIATFISMAVMLWSLAFDKSGSNSTVSEFFYKIGLLTMSPISIVLSVYVLMFATGTLHWLYKLFIEVILNVGLSTVSGLDSQGIGFQKLGPLFTTMNLYTFYNMGSMVLMFLTIFIAYNIIFNLHDWILNYFGHKGEKGLGASTESVVSEIKQRTMSKM